jgi:hypothetical protein
MSSRAGLFLNAGVHDHPMIVADRTAAAGMVATDIRRKRQAPTR